MKFRTIFLCILLVFSLTACGITQPAQTTAADTTASPDSTTVPDTTAAEVPVPESPDPPTAPTGRTVTSLPEEYTLDDLVFPYWEETLEWSDGYNNNTFTAVIPGIYPFSEDAIRCEAEIFQFMSPFAEEALDLMNRHMSVSSAAIGYDAYLNGKILSLVVWEDDNHDRITYQVFNLDLSTGKQLLSADMKTLVDISDADISAAISDAFLSKYGSKDSFTNPDLSEAYQEQYDRSIAQENIDLAQIYLGENGEAFIAANVYSLAGADYYPQLLPLNETE